MDPKLFSISKALAATAIDAYNARGVFRYLNDGPGKIASAVYEELMIGSKVMTTVDKLASNITKVSLISYWRDGGSINEVQITYRLQGLEHTDGFQRAVMATKACLKKMIRETNYQRRLNTALVH